MALTISTRKQSSVTLDNSATVMPFSLANSIIPAKFPLVKTLPKRKLASINDTSNTSSPPIVSHVNSSRRKTSIDQTANVRNIYISSNTQHNLKETSELISDNSPPPTLKKQSLNKKEICYSDLDTVIGKGKYGPVNLIIIDEELFALKKISKASIDNPKRVKHVYNEKNILKGLAGKSDFIVKLKDTFTDEFNVCFIFEFLGGKNLY